MRFPARGKICGAYVNSALASDDAHRCGFDEAIFLNDAGHVAEGSSMQHLHGAQGKTDHTSGDRERAGGITRDAVMELAQRRIGVSRLWSAPSTAASCMFATSCSSPARQVGRCSPVTQVDPSASERWKRSRDYARGAQLYFDATRGHLRTYLNWLTPVYKARMKQEQDHGSLARNYCRLKL